MPGAARNLYASIRQSVAAGGLPDVLGPFGVSDAVEVSPPDPGLPSTQAIVTAGKSVVKVEGSAPSCSRIIDGSGFVVSPQHVMTNSHVVAGTTSVKLKTVSGTYDATVVYNDESTDLAVLYAPKLQLPALTVNDTATGEQRLSSRIGLSRRRPVPSVGRASAISGRDQRAKLPRKRQCHAGRVRAGGARHQRQFRRSAARPERQGSGRRLRLGRRQFRGRLCAYPKIDGRRSEKHQQHRQSRHGHLRTVTFPGSPATLPPAAESCAVVSDPLHGCAVLTDPISADSGSVSTAALAPLYIARSELKGDQPRTRLRRGCRRFPAHPAGTHRCAHRHVREVASRATEASGKKEFRGSARRLTSGPLIKSA